MRKALRHSGVLLGTFLIGLSLIGAAYALWYEDLTLTANVSTGIFDADASIHDLSPLDGNEGLPVVAVNPTTSVFGIFNTGGYDLFAPFPANKPATTCDGAVTTTGSAPDNANDVTSNNLLTLDMTGLYPYAGCEYEIDIHNVGTVPFHVTLTSVSLDRCDINGANCVGPQPAAPWTIGIDPDEDQLAQCQGFLGAIVAYAGIPILVQYTDEVLVPLQLHATDELTCRFKLILDQIATEENVMWKFSVTYRAHQWNEDHTP